MPFRGAISADAPARMGQDKGLRDVAFAWARKLRLKGKEYRLLAHLKRDAQM